VRSQLAWLAFLLPLMAVAPVELAVAQVQEQPIRSGRPTPAITSPARSDTVPAEVSVSLREPIRIQSRPGPNPLWNVLLSAVAALVGALIGSYSSTRNSRAAIIQKTNELEAESIERKLSEFVGPFLHLSEENKILAAELKRKQPGGADFRTLTALLTPGWLESLSDGDRTLLDVVVANGAELRRLMSEKGGSAVSPDLLPYFSKASAHFRFLELAAAGGLDKDPDRYSAYVYPRQLDGVMRAEQKRLQERREALRSKPDKPRPPMPSLMIPPELRLA